GPPSRKVLTRLLNVLVPEVPRAVVSVSTWLESSTLNTSNCGEMVTRSRTRITFRSPRSSCASRSRNLDPGATSGTVSEALVNLTPGGSTSAPGVHAGTLQSKG